MGVTFATHMALRKLIAPAEMGVWTWAEPVFILLAQVRDLGVPGHVVRQSRRAYGNYLGLQLGWGGALAVVLALGAPLLAYGFAGRDAATVPILRALCLFLFVQGLGSVPLTFFEAEQEIEKTIPAELGRNVCFAALSLVLALRGWGVWSIVIAHITAASVYTAMLWWAALVEADREGKGTASISTRFPAPPLPLVLASLPLMVLSLLELAVLNLDPVILGLRLPAGVVGAAGLAILAAFFVSRQLADAAGRAVYPALVRYRDQPSRAFEVFRTATVFLLTLVVPVAFFVFWNAERVVMILTLGRADWLGAAGYLRVAAFVPLARPLTMFGRELLLVYHRDRLLIAYTLANLLALGGLGYVLIGTDLRELGMAVAGYFPLGMLMLAWGLWQLEPAGFRRLLRDIGVLYAPRARPVRADRAGARDRTVVALRALGRGRHALRRARAAAPPPALPRLPRVRLRSPSGHTLDRSDHAAQTIAGSARRDLPLAPSRRRRVLVRRPDPRARAARRARLDRHRVRGTRAAGRRELSAFAADLHRQWGLDSGDAVAARRDEDRRAARVAGRVCACSSTCSTRSTASIGAARRSIRPSPRSFASRPTTTARSSRAFAPRSKRFPRPPSSPRRSASAATSITRIVHRLAREVVPHDRLWFYEDFPYAESWRVRRRALARHRGWETRTEAIDDADLDAKCARHRLLRVAARRGLERRRSARAAAAPLPSAARRRAAVATTAAGLLSSFVSRQQERAKRAAPSAAPKSC